MIKTRQSYDKAIKRIIQLLDLAQEQGVGLRPDIKQEINQLNAAALEYRSRK